LEPGARIGIVAPAGCVEEQALLAGVGALRAEGFEVELGANVLVAEGYLAGAAEHRANDLLQFFRRGDIAAIFCARGGFGSVQLLPHLSSELKNYPKIFVGYSDITILLNWLYQSCGMVTFHAPMVADDIARGLSDEGRAHLWPVLSGMRRDWSVNLEETISPGQAVGEMIGGCLSLLVTTLGTPYEIDTRGKLLFIEDVGEAPYRIERMLIHLKMAGKLGSLAGLVFGDFAKCDGPGPRGIKEIIAELFHDAAYPVVTGMRAGHGSENLALPFGVKMRLDGAGPSLALLESPVL
jgi:muramoyltetrapeptide carboxypeptidase